MYIQNEIKELFHYQDGKLFSKINSHKRLIDQELGSVNKNGYLQLRINGKLFYLHRMIYLYHHGHLPKFIDHIDGNKCNNKIENLRAADRSQNEYNKKISKRNKSGVKGVYWCKTKNKWVSQITFNKNKKYIGCFDNLEEASNAILIYRTLYHKEFANHK